MQFILKMLSKVEKSPNLIIIVLAVIVQCVEATTLHCSLKPGCQISKCDPAPVAWNLANFGVADDMWKREFPITCETRSTKYSDIEEPSELRNQEENKDENADVKQQLEEIQKINSQLLKRLEKMENNYIQVVQKIMNMERKVVLEEQSKKDTRIETIIEKDTDEPDLIDLSKSCDVYIDDGCFFTYVQNEYSVNYTDALQTCSKDGLKMGSIRSSNAFEHISENLRKKIPKGNYTISVWIGSTINTSTLQITPPDSFLSWYPKYPRTGAAFSPYSKMYLTVAKKRNHKYQGMVNYYPSLKRRGVVCEL